MAGTVEEVSADGIGQKFQVFLSTATIEKAQELTYQAGTGWDFYAIEQQFYEYIKAKGTPDNIVLLGISPMIWRRIKVSSNSTIADLHYIIQIAMGWKDEHLHQISALFKPGLHFGSSTKTSKLWHIRI